MATDLKPGPNKGDAPKRREAVDKNSSNPLVRLIDWIARGGKKQPPCKT